MASDIRIFVRWKEQTVFAGEEIECTISFKNAAIESAPMVASRLTRTSSRQASITAKGAHYIRGKPQAAGHDARLPVRPASNKGHRAAASLSAPAPPKIQTKSQAWNNSQAAGGSSGHKHQRSVSIVSLASDDGSMNTPYTPYDMPEHLQGRSHNRAASLQILPRRFDEGSGVPSPGTSDPSLVAKYACDVDASPDREFEK